MRGLRTSRVHRQTQIAISTVRDGLWTLDDQARLSEAIQEVSRVDFRIIAIHTFHPSRLFILVTSLVTDRYDTVVAPFTRRNKNIPNRLKWLERHS